jgi:hypothetical protein
MTKRNLLLVSLLLVFGFAVAAPSLLAATTPTGVVFYASNNTNYYIRNEGDAEGVGTITLGTTSTGTIKAGSAFYITYGANLANTGTGLYAVGVTCTGDYPALCGDIKQTVGSNSPPGPPASITLADNEVILTFLSDYNVGPPTSGTQINIAVRVQAQGLPYNYEVNATVRAYYQYSQYPMTVTPTYPTPYEVAQVGPTEALSISFKEGPANVLTCIGVKDIDYFDNEFKLRLTENWPNALTSYSDEYNLENDTIVPAPSNGSNILITLTGIPPGVGLASKTPYSCAEYPSGPNGCPGGLLSLSYVGASGITYGSNGLGTESFFYTVNATNTGITEDGVFDFKLWSHGPLMPNQNYQIQATVSLTDNSPSTAPLEMPYFTLAETPVVSVVDFEDCVTKLLFPYVNTFAAGGKSAFSNFGTGMVFANTTVDPFATTDASGNYIYPDEAKGSAVPQDGNCWVYFYPSNGSAPTVYPTANIMHGQTLIFDVATATAGVVPPFANKQGYAIAVCNFQNAHGFAEIYDNYGIGDATATLGYLAEILPDPAFYHRSPAGDALGEGAIAPININKLILKLLMYDTGSGGLSIGATTTK